MNRIILIGNGFDLAHGLKTSYKDFIDDFWEQKSNTFQKAFKGGNLKFLSQGNSPECEYHDEDITIDNFLYNPLQFFNDNLKQHGFLKFKDIISQLKKIVSHKNSLSIENNFLQRITNDNLLNWVDIEEEYYIVLNECSNNSINKLNNEFSMVQTSLENYLKSLDINTIRKNQQIEQKICTFFPPYDTVVIIPAGVGLDNFLYLNFNYTNTEKLYTYPANKIIHIHGELDNPNNPIIFGYGDDTDDKYKLIEQKNDNRFLKNMKSIKYAATRNYKEMLDFIKLDKYQVYIMGHSCGISDKTLLNTLFEHENCHSIKVFYHKRPDGTDNHNDIICNISRNFSNRELFRERIIPKEDSEPL